jgi:hypothetical protein
MFLLAAATVGAASAQVNSGKAGACQLGGVTVPGSKVKSLPADQFVKLHAAMAPKGERWTEIPWETDLIEARRRAAREGKPLLMWVMDGHPLGCT